MTQQEIINEQQHNQKQELLNLYSYLKDLKEEYIKSFQYQRNQQEEARKEQEQRQQEQEKK